MLALTAVPSAESAHAFQGGPLPEDAGKTERVDKPARGPALRERGGRRSRGSSAASGVLFLVVLLGVAGFYIVKRLRR